MGADADNTLVEISGLKFAYGEREVLAA